MVDLWKSFHPKNLARIECVIESPKEMLPDAIASSHTSLEKPAAAILAKPNTHKHDGPDSLFEHAAWVYAFCREHLFRDDTARIVKALWPNENPAPGTRLIELGCGPGFYSCRLAE